MWCYGVIFCVNLTKIPWTYHQLSRPAHDEAALPALPPSPLFPTDGGVGEGQRRDNEAEVLDVAGCNVPDPALEVDIVSAVEREGNAECVDPTPTTMLEEEPIDARVKVIGGCNEGVGGEVKADRVGLAVALNAAPPRRGGEGGRRKRRHC